MEMVFGVLLGVFLTYAVGFLWVWAYQHRFRMRTRHLLIAMTLLAVVLGLIVAASS